MNDLLSNPASLNNLSMNELMHYAEEIEHPVIQRMITLYFGGEVGTNSKITELEDELRDLQDSYDSIAWEHDELEGAVEQLSAKMDEVRRKLEDLVEWDHPDEIQDELRQLLDRLE